MRQVVQIDGMVMRRPVFIDSTLIYGGGVFKLTNTKRDGQFTIALVGAAANTAAFLAYFGMLGCPAKPNAQPPIDMNRPRIDKVTLTTPITGDLISPYGTE